MASQMEQTDGVRRARHSSVPTRRNKNETWQKTVDEFQQTYVQQHPTKTRASLQNTVRRNHDDHTQEVNETSANSEQVHAMQAARAMYRNIEREQETVVQDSRGLEKRRHRQRSVDRLDRAGTEENDGFDDSNNGFRFSPTSKKISDSYYSARRRKQKETVGDRAADFVDDIVEGVRAIFSPTPPRRSRSLSRMKAPRTREIGNWSVGGATGHRSSSSSRAVRGPQNTSVVNIYQEHLTEKVRSPRRRGTKSTNRRYLTDNRTRERRDTSHSSLARAALSTDADVHFHRSDVCDEDDSVVGSSDGERLSMRSASNAQRSVGITRMTTEDDLRYCLSDDDSRFNYMSSDDVGDALLRIRPVPGSGRSSRSSRNNQPRQYSDSNPTCDRKQNIRDPVGKKPSPVTSADSGTYSTSVNVTNEIVSRHSSPERRNDITRKRPAPEPPTISRGTVTKIAHVISDNDLQTAGTSHAYGTLPQNFDAGSTYRIRDTATKGTYSTVVSLPDHTSTPRNGRHSRAHPETEPRSSVLTLTGPGAQHDAVRHVHAQTFGVYSNAPMLPLRAKGQPTRISEADVMTAYGGTFSNEPLILADLNRQSNNSEPVLTYPGYVVAESRSGTIYGTRPSLKMNKSQMLNMYVFHKVNAPTVRDSAARNEDNNVEENKVTTSHDSDTTEVVIYHKGTQTQSPINTQVLLKKRQDLIPVSRATRTRQMRSRQPRSESRYDQTDMCYEEMHSPVTEYERQVDRHRQSSSVNIATKPNIIEMRQLEQSSNTFAPPAVPIVSRDTTIQLADATDTYDEITALDLSGSDEESDDGETERVTTEEKETKIAITLYEEIEFNTSSTPGGRMISGGERGMDIDQWWIPDK